MVNDQPQAVGANITLPKTKHKKHITHLSIKHFNDGKKKFGLMVNDQSIWKFF